MNALWELSIFIKGTTVILIHNIKNIFFYQHTESEMTQW
jgi:hypothetical protein